MFAISFQTSIIAVLQIFAMGAVGYWLVRKGMIQEPGLKLLSFLSINIFFPLFIFYQIVQHFDAARMPFWWGFPLINISLVATGLMVTFLIVMRHRRPLKGEFLAASSLHNAGYIPLLMAMSLPLGALAGQVYASVILSIIGFDLCLWSLGVWLLTRTQSSPRMDLRKMINPPLISMAAALILVLALGPGFLSETFLKPVKILGDSALAVAMIVIGGNLAETNLSRVVWQRVAGVVLIKLVLLPLMVLVGLAVLRLSPMISFVAIIQASMPTATTLSIIGRNYDTKNQEFINQSIFFTHIFSMATVPIFLALYGKLV